MKTVSTSLKISDSVEQQMLRSVVESGYGLKGKSRWLNEAITRFLEIPNYAELVDIADGLENLNKVVSFRTTDDLMKKVDSAIIEVRKEYPALEGVNSRIFRASILQRLLR